MEQTPKTVAERPRVERIRILVIEDDPDQARIMQVWLEKLGSCAVTIASDGVTGYGLSVSAQWDLIIADVQIPGINGVELVQQVKRTNPNTPTIVVTAFIGTERFANRALEAQVEDFIGKPLRRKPFLERVEAALQAARRKRMNKAQLSAKTRVLAIGLRTRDIAVGCGGALLERQRKGQDIAIMTLSPNGSETQTAAIHRGGLSCSILRPDALAPGDASEVALQRAIEQVRPTVVYVPSEKDKDPAQKEVATMCMRVMRRFPNVKVLVFQSATSTRDFNPDVFYSIADQLDAKQQLLDEVAGGSERHGMLSRELVEATALYWGRFASKPAVEAFEYLC